MMTTKDIFLSQNKMKHVAILRWRKEFNDNVGSLPESKCHEAFAAIYLVMEEIIFSVCSFRQKNSYLDAILRFFD